MDIGIRLYLSSRLATQQLAFASPMTPMCVKKTLVFSRVSYISRGYDPTQFSHDKSKTQSKTQFSHDKSTSGTGSLA